jgi:hypothetical protein
MKEQKMRIIKTGECPSLSGQSTLTYQIGLEGDKKVCLSLTGNTGKGIFNKDWYDIEEIYSLLASQKKPVTSGSLHGLFENRSSNSAGFILAILLKEGLLKISPGNRHYDLVGQTEFQKIIKALIESTTAGKTAKKKVVKKSKGGPK